MSKNLLECGAFELAQLIRDKKASSKEVVQTHIAHIKQVNPKINALVEDRFNQALQEAQEFDNKPKTDTSVTALGGVPITIKEMISVEGMKSTLGSVYRKDVVKKNDATVVSRLKKAGAIVLGTSNVPEIGFWFETGNRIYGRTSNPHDLNHTSGGSSGGEAALVAAQASPLGIGSDIGGSLRIPAAFCGVFGFKPTHKLIPLTGHPPIEAGDETDFSGSNYPISVLGPIARKAVDLRKVMPILMGPDGIDPETIAWRFPAQTSHNWTNIRVFSLENPVIHLCSSTESVVQKCVQNAARYFESMGAHLEALDKKIFLNTLEMWFTKIGESKTRDFQKYLSPAGDIPYGLELLKAPFQKSQHTFPLIVAGYMDILAKKHQDSLAPHRQQALENLEQLRTRLSDLLKPPSLLIMPVHPRPAPKHGQALWRPFDHCPTAIVNALGFPAVSVPMGTSKEGLPLAVQIVGAPFSDDLVIWAAEILEEAFGGWLPAKL